MKNNRSDSRETGFILPTSLMLITLLTMLATTMYYISRSSMLTSAASNTSTTAIYYAETGANYMSWALSNDAELDSYPSYTGTYIAPVFSETVAELPVGDLSELNAYRWDPGPTAISDTGVGALGQIRYLDNSPMGGRAVCLENADPTKPLPYFPNCIDVSLKPAKRVSPQMHEISARLPRYIKLDIASNGTITPSIPALPHHATPVVGQDIPQNGAIVWLVAVDPNNNNHDIEIFPLNPTPAACGVLFPAIQCPAACAGSNVPGECPCTAPVTLDPLIKYKPDPADPQYNFFIGAQACNANPKQSDNPADLNYRPTTDLLYVSPWLSNYNIAVYAIGYVNGKPSYLLRSIIR